MIDTNKRLNRFFMPGRCGMLLLMSWPIAVIAVLFVCLCSGCDELKLPNQEKYMPRASMEVSGEKFDLELAYSNVDRTLGFMFRPDCQRNEGILFIFANARPQTFHMNNCKFDLDGIFISGAGRVLNIEYMRYPRTGESELYHSKGPAKYVLELKAGTAAAIDLRVGDKIQFPEEIKAIRAE